MNRNVFYNEMSTIFRHLSSISPTFESESQSAVTGKKQALEMLSGSKKQNDYATQAIFTLLHCHGGIDLEYGPPSAKGVLPRGKMLIICYTAAISRRMTTMIYGSRNGTTSLKIASGLVMQIMRSRFFIE